MPPVFIIFSIDNALAPINAALAPLEAKIQKNQAYLKAVIEEMEMLEPFFPLDRALAEKIAQLKRKAFSSGGVVKALHDRALGLRK